MNIVTRRYVEMLSQMRLMVSPHDKLKKMKSENGERQAIALRLPGISGAMVQNKLYGPK